MSTEGNNYVNVPGVLRSNEEIRQEHLRRVYWKDELYTRFGGGEYVKYASLATRETESPTGGDDLYEYTHGENDYGNKINGKFLPKLDGNIEKYTVKPEYRLKSWEGDYLENFTKDNKLDEIGGVAFRSGMAINEYRRADRHLETKYITPRLSYFYDTSAGILNPVSNRFAVHNATGRISDIPEAVVGFVHDILDENGNLKLGGRIDFNPRYLEELIGDGVAFYRNPSWDGENSRIDVSSSDDVSKTVEFEKNNRYKTYSGAQFHYDEMDVPADEPDSADYMSQNDRSIKGSRMTGFNYQKNNLLAKTAKLFAEHKISTLSGRFHTSNEISKDATQFDSAKTPMYGNSHGRNLLKKDHLGSKTNEYSNPYCRVWTYHHQYNNNLKLIRPFRGENDEPIGVAEIHKHAPYSVGGNGINGFERLEMATSLDKTGFVNIAPHKGETDIKKCMFSIENLAWKDVKKGDDESEWTKEQRGPNGGRIMWFPPYGLDFQENVNVDWNQSRFIGRGESVYTYSNTERNGTLSFILLIDHPSIIDNILKQDMTDSDSETNDLEADVLRFFAGCNILDVYNSEEPEEEKVVNQIDAPEVKQAMPDSGEVIKFYIFFPNNYSGHKSEEAITDKDWYTYLLFGRDVNTYKDQSTYRGYEMMGGEEQGVTENPNVTAFTRDTKDIRIQCASAATIGYGYRVDYDLRQKLVNKTPGRKDRGADNSNYTDRRSFGMNNKKYFEDATCSFYTFYRALACARPDFYSEAITGTTPYTNEEKELAEKLKGEIISAEIRGGATIQDKANQYKLAKRRKELAKELIRPLGLEEKDIKSDGIDEFDRLKDSTDINTEEAKAQRYAVITLTVNKPKISDISTENLLKKESSQSSNNVMLDTEVFNRVKNEMNGDRYVSLNNDGKLVAKEIKDNTNVTVATNASATVARRTISITKRANRYETEAEYFKKIQDKDPLIYRSIVEKVKHFDPAFHSISPEGFNARLTFLQQCTRQGHTIEASSIVGSERSAGNLAFGRMPVCVLKIGDFINTKVIIRSVSINYSEGGGMQFDLNPEGIGIQPMMAKVSLQVTILGGQSLNGPINRLQNAVSFNYYSNTEVYDNRADVRRSTKDNSDGSQPSYDRIWVVDMKADSGITSS